VVAHGPSNTKAKRKQTLLATTFDQMLTLDSSDSSDSSDSFQTVMACRAAMDLRAKLLRTVARRSGFTSSRKT